MKRNVSKSLLFIFLGLITAFVFTSASLQVSPPGPPGKPEIVNVESDRCTVKYLAPQYDGGSPITGYIIEYRCIPADKWYRVTMDRIIELEYTVRDLVEGSELQFRVRAVNAVGYSVPSKESDIVTIEDPF